MAGWYAIAKQLLPRLTRQWWGSQIPVEQNLDQESGKITPTEGGQTMDTGVQNFAQELVHALADESPIQMADTLDLVAPANGPVFNISISDDTQIIFQITNNTTNETTTVNNNTINNITNIFETMTTGFSGSATFVTSVTFSASVSGCTVTIAPTFFTKTITCSNGLVTGIS
jgi:hypothetical protein